jgi:hypothetical protein
MMQQDIIYFDMRWLQKRCCYDLKPNYLSLGIGYNPIDGINYFKGALDEVEIWDAALDAAQVAGLYATQSAPPVFVDGVVADYPFNGNAFDASTFGNHAKTNEVTFVPDRFGYGRSAASFNGVSSEITAANSAQLNGPATTVSFWINTKTLPGRMKTETEEPAASPKR